MQHLVFARRLARRPQLPLRARGPAQPRLRAARWRRRSTTGCADRVARPRRRGCARPRSSRPRTRPGPCAEIERRAADPRFVQRPAARPLGPAVRRAALPPGVRGGGGARAARSRSTSAAAPATHPRRSAGRRTTSRSTSAWSHAFEAQLTSLVAEGALRALGGPADRPGRERLHLAALGDVAPGQGVEGAAARDPVGDDRALGDSSAGRSRDRPADRRAAATRAASPGSSSRLGCGRCCCSPVTIPTATPSSFEAGARGRARRPSIERAIAGRGNARRGCTACERAALRRRTGTRSRRARARS